MDIYAVKLKVNLKIKDGTIITKGRAYRAPLQELPDFVQRMIAGKSRRLEVQIVPAPVEVPPTKVADVPTKKDVVEVVPEAVPEVVPETVVEVPEPIGKVINKRAKAKTSAKRRNKKE
jgi:hypothetical protein